MESYDISLESGTVKVKTAPDVSFETVLEKIKKTGKTVTAGSELVGGKVVTRDITLPAQV